MPAWRDITELPHEELLALIISQQKQLQELHALVERLKAELEQARRSGKKQAAPFSTNKPKSDPKKPGRKRGEGQFTNRQAPTEDEITEPLVLVPVTHEGCPCCGGNLEAAGVEMAYTTDLPKDIRATVTAYEVSVCRCTDCGKKVKGSHPDVAPDQHGATAHRVSPRVMAVAHLLHFDTGVPVRKIPAVLKLLCGIVLTQSAISQDCLRRSKAEVGDAYQQLRASVKSAQRVHTDDTGWRIGGVNAQLMGFETEQAAVFQIRKQHRNEEVRELIPSDFPGVMITDRGRSYDAKEFDEVKQQKCIGHIQRSIAAVVEKHAEQELPFCIELKRLLKEAVELWHSYHNSHSNIYRGAMFKFKAWQLKSAITDHLLNRDLSNPDCQRLLNGIGWHHDRGNLLRFLDDPRIEPTNNRAERALRPAVIARKVSQCSKNEEGAEAYAAFTSVVQTLRKNGVADLADELTTIFSTGRVQCLSP